MQLCELTLPGDKSISHRALILAALSKGTSTIVGLLESEDVQATRTALQELGVTIETISPGKIKVHGRSGNFHQPARSIDCGNSGTTMRLLAGLLAAQPFSSELIGDASLSQRPMQRIIEPLQAMGATLRATGKRNYPPLHIEGATLTPITYTLPVASAQVKSAILLAALSARGESMIIEPVACRDHTERLFSAFQINASSMFDEKLQSQIIRLVGPQRPIACDLHIPGDISSAAFWIVAAAARSGSRLHLKNVGLNPTRTGILSVLKRMGAQLEIDIAKGSHHEPYGTIIVDGSSLTSTLICGKEIPNVIDELPILAVAGALAQGTTIIRDAQELRLKETDRITAIITNLRAMGVTVTEYDDGFAIQGGALLQGASLKSYGDHRIAMAFSIAALFAQGTTSIDDTSCIQTSYPGFAAELDRYTISC